MLLCALFLVAGNSYGFPEELRWHDLRNCTELNSPADEFAPVAEPGSDRIVFCSTETGISKFYQAEFSSRDHLSGKGLFPLSLQQGRNQYSYLCFAPERQIYFSAFRKGIRNSFLNIFKTGRDDIAGAEAMPLENINEATFTGHPTVSSDGRTLIFSSDRAGGQGGADLWVARRESAQWSAPVNLSEILNSEGSEITPFLASNDTLYFASNGHGGKGGYEIFLSVQAGGVWQTPVPLANLNTEADESDFVPVNANLALYSSNKAGGRGGLDLYLAEFGNFADDRILQHTELSLKSSVNFLSVTQDRSPAPPVQAIPAVFFARNSAELPYELRRLGDTETGSFTEESIEFPMDSVYAHLLNIIGFRMRQRPEALIRVRGFGENDEQAQIAAKRTEAIREYLVRIWAIDPDRIAADIAMPHEKSSSGKNRRAEILSDDSELLRPLFFSARRSRIQPESMSFSFDARPRNSVKQWKFAFQNEARFIPLDEGNADRLPRELSLKTGFLTDEALSGDSLVFSLSAEMNSGEIIRTPLNISIQRIILQNSGNAMAENFVIFVFDPAKATVESMYGGLLAHLRKRLEEGAQVGIRYFSAARNSGIVEIAAKLAGSLSPDDAANAVSIRESDTPLSVLHSLVQRFPDAALLISVEKSAQ